LELAEQRGRSKRPPCIAGSSVPAGEFTAREKKGIRFYIAHVLGVTKGIRLFFWVFVFFLVWRK